MAYSPKIGEEGVFDVAAPFDKLLVPRVIYTCRSLRSFNELLAENVNIFDRVYAPVGADAEGYQQDATENAIYVILQAGSGQWAFIPQKYIRGAPSLDGVRYMSVVMGIGLGPLPDDMKLDDLIDRITEIVQREIGVDPQIKAVIPSQPVLISQDEHVRTEQAREQHRAEFRQGDPTYDELKQQLADAKEFNKKMEEALKAHLF